jgi:RNA polymerase sigma-70 factor (ECF subfamily)
VSTTADFQQLVDQYYAQLFRFALSLSKSNAEAADLAQQTFFIWASKGHKLRDNSKARSWLFTTLYREFLRRRRHEVRFPKMELEEVRGEKMSTLPNMNALEGATVVEELRGLNESLRVPLTLFYLHQLSYREIADMLEIPIGTVMSRLSRGKALLRQRVLSDQRAQLDLPSRSGFHGR